MDAYAMCNPHAATVSLKSSPSEKVQILNHAHCRIPFTEHSRTNKRYLRWWKGNQRLGARDRGGNWLQRGGREFDVMGYFMSWWGWSYLHAHRLSKMHQAVHLKSRWFIHVQRDFLKLLSKRTKDLTRHITEKMSEWPMSLWKDAQDDLVSGEHRLISQWVALNAHLGRVALKQQTATNGKTGPGDSQTRACKMARPLQSSSASSLQVNIAHPTNLTFHFQILNQRMKCTSTPRLLPKCLWKLHS